MYIFSDFFEVTIRLNSKKSIYFIAILSSTILYTPTTLEPVVAVEEYFEQTMNDLKSINTLFRRSKAPRTYFQEEKSKKIKIHIFIADVGFKFITTASAYKT